jgi:hypothetical protein
MLMEAPYEMGIQPASRVSVRAVQRSRGGRSAVEYRKMRRDV